MRVSFAVLLALLWFAFTSEAQTPQTREEALKQERAAKNAALAPNELNRVQRVLAMVEERGLFLTARDGFHPKIGRLATGSGFALGAGWRNRDVFKRHGTFETFAAGTFRQYWAFEARATFPDLARGRLMADAVATLREYPRESFFGIGPDARQADHSTFLLRTKRVGGSAGIRLLPLTTVGAGLDYIVPRVGGGRGGRRPSVEDTFDAAALPGFSTRVDYLRSSTFVEFDYRKPKNARQGGFYRVDFSRFHDRTRAGLTFNRTDVDLRQYLGFLAGRRVIALRGLLSTTHASDGNEVPFYFMPFLGGKDTLRGFRNYRFRGPHALLVQAEYRWEIWSALEGALFYDTGSVAFARRDLNLKQHAYGFGFRFNTDDAVVMRFDAAFGSRDGKRLHMSLGGVF